MQSCLADAEGWVARRAKPATKSTLTVIVCFAIGILSGCQGNRATDSYIDRTLENDYSHRQRTINSEQESVKFIASNSIRNDHEQTVSLQTANDYQTFDGKDVNRHAVDTRQQSGPKSTETHSVVKAASFQPIQNSNNDVLSLNDILFSVQQCYPAIDIAVGELQSADGKIVASLGAFDSTLDGHSISQPLGFYQTYRNGVGLTRQLYSGGEIYGAYRIGDGNFEPWYGERETNEAGEFKFGFSLPLLKDTVIDERRAKLTSANLQRDQLSFNVDSRLLLFQRFASQSYWNWVAAGQVIKVQQELLDLAQKRVELIKARVARGDLAQLANIDNDRFIAKRKNSLIKANLLLRQAAIKMSLYFRDQQCNPVIANQNQLPMDFSLAEMIGEETVNADIQSALTVRPELAELRTARQEACVDLQYARNLTLPKVDLKGFAGQDIGGAASSKGDKTPFEMQLGVMAEVPIQRREGLGKIRVAQGKIAQIDAKLQLVSDKIRAEIQDAASAVNAAFEQIQQSRENLRLTRESLRLGRISFDAGNIDLIQLNIYETSVADAQLQLIDAQFSYFYYRAIYDAAIQSTAFQNQLNTN